MSAVIDLVKFQQFTGDLKWLPVVAGAFLRQLPEWRSDFAAALAEHNLGRQIDLLHKIKGSCYAVAAYDATELIALSEAAHALGHPLVPSALLRHLDGVEAELLAIVASAEPPK